MKRIMIHEFGGPEVMKLKEMPAPPCTERMALVRVTACGVNFIDIYQRTGLYKNPLPYPIGLEGAGVVESVGDGVRSVAPGDRVAWTGIPGSYCDMNLVPADRLLKVPKWVDDRTAAASMLQGMAAHYLARSTYRLRKGDTCLIHAAAGGVGLLLCQIARKVGARVIGTAGTDEKTARAREAGAHEVINYEKVDFEVEVRRLTDGKGVQVVYDSVGKSTFERSLNCLSRRGMLVLFGQSSGPVPAFDPSILNTKGSLYLTRPSLFHYIATRDELLERSHELFNWIKDGTLKIAIGATFSLDQAADAHRALEERRTTGKVLLIP